MFSRSVTKATFGHVYVGSSMLCTDNFIFGHRTHFWSSRREVTLVTKSDFGYQKNMFGNQSHFTSSIPNYVTDIPISLSFTKMHLLCSYAYCLVKLWDWTCTRDPSQSLKWYPCARENRRICGFRIEDLRICGFRKKLASYVVADQTFDDLKLKFKKLLKRSSHSSGCPRELQCRRFCGFQRWSMRDALASTGKGIYMWRYLQE